MSGTLHLIAFPPSRHDLLALLRSTLVPEDQLLLMESAVLMAGAGVAAEQARAAWAGHRCQVIEDDLTALGIRPVPGIDAISWVEAIALSEQLPRSLSWWP
ncbi:DsrH/TusB family sulfur metabolism protein [Alcanivorax quisquiliarum]|uniref:tRNA 2-thiouridine synthesizing protein B n=1 Tax=Alcanivorax quisquiliarum TaxID=2933565 RepID=A0ABT0E3A5_9GAMM|nr:DsrH/TusB family sulfur metabolism protein [Alcanivorax quisquiliarum]MCK0536301.1 hypothetical protein [Alcanivorax quisquiliarum]